MSVKVMGRVWDANLRPNEKLVLLAYADAAEHDGTAIYPGWERLTSMTSYSRSQIDRTTKELLRLGVLVRVGRGRTGRRAEFRIPLDHPLLTVAHIATLSDSDCVASDADCVASVPKECRTHAPPPVLDPSSTPVLKEVAPPRRDLLWEAFVAVHGEPATESERGKFNRAVKKLRNANVTGDEYPMLVQAYTSKNHGNQPAPLTIANERVGEMRHYLKKGPIQTVEPDELARRRRFADLEQEQHALEEGTP